MRYCVDTCALIDAWRDYHPDVLPDLWAHNMPAAIRDGSIVSPEEVLIELRRGTDDLQLWAKRNSQMFLPLDGNIQGAVKQVLADFPPIEHSADIFVIATAMVRDAVIVTHEKKRGYRNNPNAIPKIPDVCEHYSVRCVRFPQLIREKGWKFYAQLQ